MIWHDKPLINWRRNLSTSTVCQYIILQSCSICICISKDTHTYLVYLASTTCYKSTIWDLYHVVKTIYLVIFSKIWYMWHIWRNNLMFYISWCISIPQSSPSLWVISRGWEPPNPWGLVPFPSLRKAFSEGSRMRCVDDVSIRFYQLVYIYIYYVYIYI